MMTNGQKTLIATSIMVIAIVGFMAWLIKVTDPGPKPEPVFSNGQYVASKLSGQRGQIVRTICYRGAVQCRYLVRFIGLSITTQTSLFGPDGPVSTEPLSIVDMYEFELIAD